MQHQKEMPTLHFFFDPLLNAKLLDGRNLLSSLIKQMIGFLKTSATGVPLSLVDKIREFYGSDADGSVPDVDELGYQIFVPLIHLSCRRPTIIIDGLDQCSRRERAKIIPILRATLKHKTRLFISSQEEVNVLVCIKDSAQIWISKNDTGIKNDIEAYIEDRLDFKMQERLLIETPEMFRRVRSELLHKADAMLVPYIICTNKKHLIGS